jgi:hypothetical protein
MIEKNTIKTKPPTTIEEPPIVPVARPIRRPMTKQKFINRVLLIVLVVAIGFGGYFYYQLHNLQKDKGAEASKEVKDLLGKVAKLYLIPTGEEPTVATVSDPEALKDQSFFTSSVKGDKVLIFTKAGKAVLYRPSIDKIIEVAPINNKKDETPPPTPEKSTGPLKDKTF